ncbi:MAG: EAL domain-containing protein, partial [Spirochaetales bacterium]|nr:EAL domain-containing protein [Spirochaetales bacterium]
GMGSSVRYNPEIGLETRERIRLLHELRNAFQSEKLFLMYQPQVDIKSGKPIGFEALLRWKSSDGAFIPPSTFIPLAEQGGLIVPMGRWIMKSAMHALKELQHSTAGSLRMAINVSAIQLSSYDFLEHLKRTLKETRVPPELVDLEITESAAILGAEKVLALFHEIKALGLSISIDDFGTGYSSLSSIDSWPADRLKIDRSFVKDLGVEGQGGRIVDLVIPLGQKLGMQVLAEGIETEEQAGILLDLGCPEGQGYLYGKPMTLKEARKWLKERS